MVLNFLRKHGLFQRDPIHQEASLQHRTMRVLRMEARVLKKKQSYFDCVVNSKKPEETAKAEHLKLYNIIKQQRALFTKVHALDKVKVKVDEDLKRRLAIVYAKASHRDNVVEKRKEEVSKVGSTETMQGTRMDLFHNQLKQEAGSSKASGYFSAVYNETKAADEFFKDVGDELRVLEKWNSILDNQESLLVTLVKQDSQTAFAGLLHQETLLLHIVLRDESAASELLKEMERLSQLIEQWETEAKKQGDHVFKNRKERNFKYLVAKYKHLVASNPNELGNFGRRIIFGFFDIAIERSGEDRGGPISIFLNQVQSRFSEGELGKIAQKYVEAVVSSEPEFVLQELAMEVRRDLIDYVVRSAGQQGDDYRGFLTIAANLYFREEFNGILQELRANAGFEIYVEAGRRGDINDWHDSEPQRDNLNYVRAVYNLKNPQVGISSNISSAAIGMVPVLPSSIGFERGERKPINSYFVFYGDLSKHHNFIGKKTGSVVKNTKYGGQKPYFLMIPIRADINKDWKGPDARHTYYPPLIIVSGWELIGKVVRYLKENPVELMNIVHGLLPKNEFPNVNKTIVALNEPANNILFIYADRITKKDRSHLLMYPDELLKNANYSKYVERIPI